MHKKQLARNDTEAAGLSQFPGMQHEQTLQTVHVEERVLRVSALGRPRPAPCTGPVLQRQALVLVAANIAPFFRLRQIKSTLELV